MANYLSYWKPENAHNDYDGGWIFDRAWNSRYDKVKAGDILWMVTSENQKLILLARGEVENSMPQSEAMEDPLLKDREIWPAESSWKKYWAKIKNPQKLQWIDITDIAPQLTFASKSNPRLYEDPAKWGNALQTLRTLTPESAQLLQSRLPNSIKSENSEEIDELNIEIEEKAFGAGFGDPILNREVEKAAIQFVTSHYKNQGWSVTSKEQEKCGYDLLCEHGNQIHHVEVKGIQGNKESIILTRNEVNYLEQPLSFVCLVTSALTSPNLSSYTGEEFKKQFKLDAFAFKASKV
ncbi:MAG: DUF3883 domain-containing protein [Rhabdochlamydiaceae bacterium]